MSTAGAGEFGLDMCKSNREKTQRKHSFAVPDNTIPSSLKGRIMFGTHNLGIFLLAGIALNLIPGQDTLYIIGRSIAQGRVAGIVSVIASGMQPGVAGV
ncbi:MAG: hypothetical protein WC620_03705 [Methanoregula sp.]|jgi:hypothetical protein